MWPYSKRTVVTFEISATLLISSIRMAAYLGQFRKSEEDVQLGEQMHMKDIQWDHCGKDADSSYCNPSKF